MDQYNFLIEILLKLIKNYTVPYYSTDGRVRCREKTTDSLKARI
jgi:hypothetical protein